MPLNTLSLNRPLTSYAKVEPWIGRLVRNRRFQLRRERVRHARYLDLGAGRLMHDGFIHMDFMWHRGIDVCWDVTRGLPFAGGSLQGIFSQHMFEHFDLPVVRGILAECRRVLAPGGTLRVVVPDAELYLRNYVARADGTSQAKFPYEEFDRMLPAHTPILSVNRIFYVDRNSPFGHRTMYDFALLRSLLELSGFTEVTKRSFGEGRDPALVVDSQDRVVESLYVEATVPR